VIWGLLDRGILSDERYARLWLQSRLYRGDSPRKLSIALRGRGLDAATVKAALESVLDRETETVLLERWLARYGEGGRICREDRGSGAEIGRQPPLRRRLRWEGFSPALISLFNEEGRL
jgi:SOS response regulatory protein OraA/RecX